MPLSAELVNGAAHMPSFYVILKITVDRDHRSPISQVRQALGRFGNLPDVRD